MRMKIGYFGLLVCFISLPTQQIAAQSFWKKVGKAIEKELTTPETEPTTPAAKADAEPVNVTNREKAQDGTPIATLYSGKDVALNPVISENAKIISVDEAPSNVGVGFFRDGLAFVRTKKETYFIDTLGNKVLSFPYTIPSGRPIPYFSEGVCPVHDYKVTHLIDKTGKKIATFKNIYQLSNFVDGVATGFMSVPSGLTTIKKIVYINTKGQFVFSNLSEQVTSGDLETPRSLRNGLAAFYSYSRRQYGFRDKNGKVIISPQFTKVRDFCEGLAAVQYVDGKWGFIDVTGRMVIPANFTNQPSSFSEKLAVVMKKDNTCCYIDTVGNVVSSDYEKASGFWNGYAFVGAGFLGTYILDRNFKKVACVKKTMNFEQLIPDSGIIVNHKYAYLFKTSSFITSTGDEIFYADQLYPFFDNLAYCVFRTADDSTKYTTGFINRKGEFVIIFRETEF